MPDWFVPETYYYLCNEGMLIGEFRIRHHLTDALRNGAGHIGYSIKKDAFDKFGTKKLPTMKELDTEFQEVLAKKRAAYSEYRVAKDNMTKYQIAKYDIGRILGITESPEQNKNKTAGIIPLNSLGHYLFYRRWRPSFFISIVIILAEFSFSSHRERSHIENMCIRGLGISPTSVLAVPGHCLRSYDRRE